MVISFKLDEVRVSSYSRGRIRAATRLPLLFRYFLLQFSAVQNDKVPTNSAKMFLRFHGIFAILILMDDKKDAEGHIGNQTRIRRLRPRT